MRRPVPLRRLSAFTMSGCLALTALTGAIAPTAIATEAPHHPRPSRTCSPTTDVVGYSDALNKLTAYGAQVGGLSDLAWDARSRSVVASLDNNKSDPSRLWFVRDLAHPTPSRAPLVLRQADGTAYTGLTADNEGLAVSRRGDFIVSSEVEPSIRVFGRDGVQKATLPVPDRFQVAPKGEATTNATLEGLTLSPDKRRLVAAMEGTLSGDKPANGASANARRFLVYADSHRGWRLTEQLGYAVDDGMRIAEVQEYAPGKLLVLEASWSATAGNDIRLYAVTGMPRAKDVSTVANLSTRPDLLLRKRLVADLAACPTLGATSLGTQTNPLLDNYEGMITAPRGHGRYRVALVSDDNISATQRTRVLTLSARLP